MTDTSDVLRGVVVPLYHVEITCPDGVVVGYDHLTLKQVTGSVQVWATEPGYRILVVCENS